MRCKALVCRFLMCAVIVAPYYDFFMNTFPDLVSDKHNLGYLVAHFSMLIFPTLTSLVFEDKTNRIKYIFICYGIIAISDYTHALLYGIIYELTLENDISLLKANEILKYAIVALKIVFGNIIFSKTLDKTPSTE